jgi:hypothetical protein
MHLKPIQVACLIAGAVLSPGLQRAAFAQDANRDVVDTKSDVRGIVDRLAKRAGDFKEEFDKALDHSLLDGSKMEDKAKHRADDLHDSAKKLRDVFNDKRDKNNPAVRDQVDKTLAAGADVNHILQEHRLTDKVQRDWDLLRSDLNALAAVYQLSPL